MIGIVSKIWIIIAALAVTTTVTAKTTGKPWAQGLQHPFYFALYVEDVDRAVDWYKTTFGLQVLHSAGAEDGSWRIENLGNEVLRVEVIRHPKAAVAQRPLGWAKVGFYVSDVEQVAERVFQASGHRPDIVDFKPLNQRILQLKDPEGNVIQLHSISN